MSQQPVIIIGSGLAGYTLAREFRKLDSTSPLVMLSSDHGGFYSKPMLSNALSQGKTPDALLMKSADQMAVELNASIIGNVQVTSIDAQNRVIEVNGSRMQFRQLVLALGADPVKLPLQGSGAGAVMSINNLDDYRQFRQALAGHRRVAILGAGLIGCEFANDLAASDHQVDVIDPSPQLLGRLLPAAGARFMQRRLEAGGITFHLNTSVSLVEKQGSAYRLELENSTVIEAEVVLSAVGLRPRAALAQNAGISVNRGILVDSTMQTSVEGIYAIGDCAEIEGKLLPFVMPIMHGARALAQTLAGKLTSVAYPVMPITVKTPACPAVIVMPPQMDSGKWSIESEAEGIRALFHTDSGKLQGFSLLGNTVGEKSVLLQQIMH